MGSIYFANTIKSVVWQIYLRLPIRYLCLHYYSRYCSKFDLLTYGLCLSQT
jgi:hypothetical protein